MSPVIVLAHFRLSGLTLDACHADSFSLEGSFDGESFYPIIPSEDYPIPEDGCLMVVFDAAKFVAPQFVRLRFNRAINGATAGKLRVWLQDT